MKTHLIPAAGLAAALVLAGCETVPPGAERGPDGTIAYDVLIEASPPGARIEANGSDIGATPVHLKIFGDTDGTFHDFGSYYYVIRALPITTNQYVQTYAYRTGRWFTPEDRVPQRIYFDMNRPTPAYATPGPPPYDGPPVYYYGPPAYYYGPPVYYGPQFEFFVSPHPPHHHW